MTSFNYKRHKTLITGGTKRHKKAQKKRRRTGSDIPFCFSSFFLLFLFVPLPFVPLVPFCASLWLTVSRLRSYPLLAVFVNFLLPNRHSAFQLFNNPLTRFKRRATMRRAHRDRYTRLTYL